MKNLNIRNESPNRFSGDHKQDTLVSARNGVRPYKQRLMLSALSALMLLTMTACGKGTPSETTVSSQPPATTSAPATLPYTTPPVSETTAPEGEAKLYIVFDQEQPDVYDLPSTGTVDAAVLLQGLSALTGWNCDVNKVEILSGMARVDLAKTALPFVYDERTSNSFTGATYADTVFLFLDSIQQTLMKNLALSGVIFTQDGGQPLQLDRLRASVELFPADTAYRGSAYYRALLQDDEPNVETGDYEMVQLAGGMTILTPKGFLADGETDSEYHLTYEEGGKIAAIIWRAHELPSEPTPEQAAEQQIQDALVRETHYMTEVLWQTSSTAGYELDGFLGTYRYHVTGFMAPVKSAYYEVIFLYDDQMTGVDMPTIVRDLSYALSHYN